MDRNRCLSNLVTGMGSHKKLNRKSGKALHKASSKILAASLLLALTATGLPTKTLEVYAAPEETSVEETVAPEETSVEETAAPEKTSVEETIVEETTAKEASEVYVSEEDTEEETYSEAESTEEDPEEFVATEFYDFPDPVFSVPACYFDKDFELVISKPEGFKESEDDPITIYYQVGGEDPGRKSEVYQGPLKVKASSEFKITIVRAIMISKSGKKSRIVTASYISGYRKNTDKLLQVVSIVTDPFNLEDSETGLFMNPDGRGREWERPASFELFPSIADLNRGADPEAELSQRIGIRLHGGASRKFDLASLRLYAREEYDDEKWFEYPFFEDSFVPAKDVNGNEIERFKRLIVRNGGNEATGWNCLLFRDAMLQSLMTDTDIPVQGYCPTEVYINGEYYGLLNIRERMDRYYLASHYLCSKNDVVIYTFSYDGPKQVLEVSEGEESDAEFYEEFWEIVNNEDLSKPESYAKVESMMDLDQAARYYAFEILIGNCDWPGNNQRLWRYKGEPREGYLDGRMRYLLYDTEFSLDIYGNHPADEDYLEKCLMAGSTQLPNQDESTLLFRKLMQNQDFEAMFCTYYLDYCNTKMDPEVTGARLDEMAALYRPYFDKYRQKYNRAPLDQAVSAVKKFLNVRPGYAIEQLGDNTSYKKEYHVTVNMDVEGLARLRVNSIEDLAVYTPALKGGKFTGTYMKGLPLEVEAVPAEGWHFVCWNNDPSCSDNIYHLNADETKGNIKLVPVFAKGEAEGQHTEPARSIDFPVSKANSGKVTTFLSLGLAAVLAVFFVISLSISKSRKKKMIENALAEKK